MLGGGNGKTILFPVFGALIDFSIQKKKKKIICW
jgi:hypothetical protein